MTGWMQIIVGSILTSTILLAESQLSPGQASYEKANDLFVSKKFNESLVAVDKALRLDSNLIPAHTLKAKLYMAANRNDLAQQSLERALSIDPKAPYAQFLYGLTAFLNNDLKEALPRLRKARELAPNDYRAALYLGLTIESIGSTAEALKLYQEAVRLERIAGPQQAETLLPGVKLLLLLDRLDECEKWIRQALNLSPKLRDVHFEWARLLLKRGQALQAAEEGELALSLSEGTVTDSAIHYVLIRAWRQCGRQDRADLHAGIMRALEAPTNNPPAK